MHTRNTHQRGFTLIELGLVVLLGGIISSMALLSYRNYMDSQAAEAHGRDAAQIVRAVQSYIAQPNALTIIPAGTTSLTGVDYLRRAATCPGGTNTVDDFLPCWMPSDIPEFGLVYRTTFVNNGVSIAATMIISSDGTNGPGATGPTGWRETNNVDLASTMVTIINGATSASFVPSGWASFSRAVNDTTRGIITVDVTARPANELYLRVDGGNQMAGNIQFAGANRNIVNADNIQSTSVTTGRINDSDDNTTFIDPSGASNVADLTARNITATATLTAPALTDSNNPLYVVNPDGNSTMWTANIETLNVNRTFGNQIDVTTLNGNTVNANSLNANTANIDSARINNQTVNSSIVQDQAVSGNNFARRLTDLDDASYGVDPDGVSRLNDVQIASRGNYRLSALLPNMALVDILSVSSNATTVTKPNCDGGTPRVIGVMKAFSQFIREPTSDHGLIHNNTAAPVVAFDMQASDLGAAWRLNPVRYDPVTKSVQPAPDGSWQALAHVYCWYP